MGYLIWRDVKIRYKQTVLGAMWAIIQPLLMMAVFTIFFGRLGGMSHSVKGSYPVFVFAGLLPWTLFATAVTQAGQSLMANANLVNKVYFPRLILPIASMGNGIVDFGVSFVMLLVLMVWYGVGFHASLLLSPIFFLGTILTTVGFGTLLAAWSLSIATFAMCWRSWFRFGCLPVPWPTRCRWCPNATGPSTPSIQWWG